jgi:hypothetical protein
MGDDPVEENRFWSLIESAWEGIDGQAEARRKFAAGELSEDVALELANSLRHLVMPAMLEQLDRLSADDLLAFQRILERKLYDIDRADIAEYAAYTDDGFLYARGFIAAVGKDYYEAVKAQPSLAMSGWQFESEDMCYVAQHVYEQKFGELPPGEVSFETGSNREGWPDLD